MQINNCPTKAPAGVTLASCDCGVHAQAVCSCACLLPHLPPHTGQLAVNKFNFNCQAYDHPLREVTLSHIISELDTRGQHRAKSGLLNPTEEPNPSEERGPLQLQEGVGWT